MNEVLGKHSVNSSKAIDILDRICPFWEKGTKSKILNWKTEYLLCKALYNNDMEK